MELKALQYATYVTVLAATSILQVAGTEQCGHPVVPPTSTRIVGGQEARVGSWPWMAMVAERGVQVCGGTIVNEYFILTAAHCFEDGHTSDPANWLVFVGKHNVVKHDPGESQHSVREIIIHASFDNKTLKNDIALLWLQDPISYSDNVKPVCIPPTRRRVVAPGHLCYSTGWGDTMGTGSPYVLNQVALPIISEYWCSRSDWYGNQFIHSLTFCAGYAGGGRDACSGDSGGPFVCKVGDTWYQQGVISWGHQCALPHYPGIYTDVSKYGQWIRAHMQYRGQPLIMMGK